MIAQSVHRVVASAEMRSKIGQSTHHNDRSNLGGGSQIMQAASEVDLGERVDSVLGETSRDVLLKAVI